MSAPCAMRPKTIRPASRAADSRRRRKMARRRRSGPAWQFRGRSAIVAPRALPRATLPGAGLHVLENSGFRGLLPTWSGRSRRQARRLLAPQTKRPPRPRRPVCSLVSVRMLAIRLRDSQDNVGIQFARSRPRRSTVRRSRTTNSPPLPSGRASAFEPLDSVASIAAKASRVIEIVTMRHYGLRHARPVISPHRRRASIDAASVSPKEAGQP